MTMTKNSLLITFGLLYFSACGQIRNKREQIILVTNELITSLKNCDTTAFLNMLDSDFSHTNQSNYRDFIKESFLEDCSVFRLIINRHSLPNINNIQIGKDSSHLPPANIVTLTILDESDTILNIKKCFLVLAFYPDEYFSSNAHLLKYSLIVEKLKSNENKIIIPDWLKELNKKHKVH